MEVAVAVEVAVGVDEVVVVEVRVGAENMANSDVEVGDEEVTEVEAPVVWVFGGSRTGSWRQALEGWLLMMANKISRTSCIMIKSLF